MDYVKPKFQSRPPSKEYRDRWEETFGKKEPEVDAELKAALAEWRAPEGEDFEELARSQIECLDNAFKDTITCRCELCGAECQLVPAHTIHRCGVCE